MTGSLAIYDPGVKYGLVYLAGAVVVIGIVPIVVALRSRAGTSIGVKLQVAAVAISVLLVALAMLAIVYTNQLPRDGDPTAYARAVTHSKPRVALRSTRGYLQTPRRGWGTGIVAGWRVDKSIKLVTETSGG